MKKTQGIFWGLVVAMTALFPYFRSDRSVLASSSFPIPISFYEFDQNTGETTLKDSIRLSAGDGTFYGTPTFETGRVGNALCFDSTTDYATAPIVTGVQSEFTISAWAKLTSVPQLWATIVKNWGDAQVGTFHLGLDGTGARWSNFIGLTPSGSPSVATPTDVTSGQWYHVVTTASQSAQKIRMYINGVSVAENSFDGVITTFGSLMSFGAKLNDAQNGIAPVNPGYLNGCLDEVAFWDTALTPTDVANIYSSGESGTSPIGTTTTTVAITDTTVPVATTVTTPTTNADVVTDSSSTTTTIQPVEATQDVIEVLPESGAHVALMHLVVAAMMLVSIGFTLVVSNRIIPGSIFQY